MIRYRPELYTLTAKAVGAEQLRAVLVYGVDVSRIQYEFECPMRGQDLYLCYKPDLQ